MSAMNSTQDGMEDTSGQQNSQSSQPSNFLEETWKKFKNFFTHQPENKKPLEEASLNGVAELIRSGKVKKIVVMTGAGVSTSAGIPDFRSPNTGLYANMGKYNLPHPQAMFESSYFKHNPEPFFALAKQLFPNRLKPTLSHYFLHVLYEKGILLRVYTQNIDSLEHLAGLPEEKVIEAHGSFHTGHCLGCNTKFDFDWLKANIQQHTVPKCNLCHDVVKPDVVLFGENLPRRFFNGVEQDFPQCDLLLIMGTSLVVHPFAGLIGKVGHDVPRLLINKEKAGLKNIVAQCFTGRGLEFDRPNNCRDIFWQGSCDDGCLALAKLLDLDGDLMKLKENGWAMLDQEYADEPHKAALKT